MINKYVRGQIWLIDTAIRRDDGVFSGKHFGLVLGSYKDRTVTIVPSTSSHNPEYELFEEVPLEICNLDGEMSVGHFIPNMVQTLDARKVCRYIGTMDKEDVEKVTNAVNRYLSGDTEINSSKSLDILAKDTIEDSCECDEERKYNLDEQNEEDQTKIYETVTGKKPFDFRATYGKHINQWPERIQEAIKARYASKTITLSILARLYDVPKSTLHNYLQKNM